VGYLEQGRLLFSEEMQVLSGRFREVTVTLDKPQALPENLPAAWLQPQTVDCLVRFVHSGYEEDVAQKELAEIFPAARDSSFDPMTLRSIFLAIAKNGRDSAASTSNRTAPQEARA
jgi:ABC-2 type transport system ATP-binding protein